MLACQAGLARPSVGKGTPLRTDASTPAFSPVGADLSVEHAVISATAKSDAAVRAIAREALGRKSGERTGMSSPCAMYALRLATGGGRHRQKPKVESATIPVKVF